MLSTPKILAKRNGIKDNVQNARGAMVASVLTWCRNDVLPKGARGFQVAIRQSNTIFENLKLQIGFQQY